jgi:protein phosphatase
VPDPDPGEGTVVIRFRSSGATAVGGRTTNQDAHHASSRIVAVADGVGGRPAGELASRLAIQGVLEADAEPDLAMMMRRINQRVRHRAMEDPGTAGMATTLDLLVLRDGPEGAEVFGAHIGDGIMLLQTGARTETLTREHTLATELVEARQMSAREMRMLPERGTLLRAIGLSDEIAADFWRREAMPGDRYVLASDGLLNALGMEDVQKALRALRAFGPDVCAHELVNNALRVRASDNVTVVVADIVADGPGTDLIPSRRYDHR